MTVREKLVLKKVNIYKFVPSAIKGYFVGTDGNK